MIKLVSFFGLLSVEFDFIVLPKINYQLKLSIVIIYKYRATFTDSDVTLRGLSS